MKDKIMRRIPFIGKLIQQRDSYKRELDTYKSWVPPGHFYSPIPSIPEFEQHKSQLYQGRSITGINLREEEQLETLRVFGQYYSAIPFRDQPTEGYRYYYNNVFFRYLDAIALYSMMRQLKPQRIIEVGSGYSSAVILDTNEHFLNNQVQLTFIEPYPERLQSLLKPTDQIQLLETKLQDVDPDVFSQLKENDILFIDSTHVSKVGSDVNTLFFEIIPRLNPGVYIHVHDIFFPFEYPEAWIYEGRAWNEVYLLRAFMQFNPQFEIQFFNSYLGKHHADLLKAQLPIALKDTGGSIWLKRTA